MKNRKIILFLTVIFSFLFSGYICAEIKPIAKGASFPDVLFQNRLTKEERSYLGLSGKRNFSLKDMGGTLFIVEVFSTYCTSCPKDIPVLNTVYSSIESDPRLKGNVKVISIAVGNNDTEAASFKKEYGVLYPLLTDNHFTAHKALGNPRVPYTILVKRTVRGIIVVHTHQGVLDSPDDVLKKVMNFFRN